MHSQGTFPYLPQQICYLALGRQSLSIAAELTQSKIVPKLEDLAPGGRHGQQKPMEKNLSLKLRVKKQVSVGGVNGRVWIGEPANIGRDLQPSKERLR